MSSSSENDESPSSSSSVRKKRTKKDSLDMVRFPSLHTQHTDTTRLTHEHENASPKPTTEEELKKAMQAAERKSKLASSS